MQEILDSRKIYEAIWTYNLGTSKEIDESEWSQAEFILTDMIKQLMKLEGNPIEIIQCYFDTAVQKLEILFDERPLEDASIYEYGGLNDFFAEIVEAFGLPVRYGEYCLLDDFVYKTKIDDI